MSVKNIYIPGISRWSIRFRIVAMLLVVASCLLAANMAYTYLGQKQQLRYELDNTATNVISRLAFTMSQPLWNFDQKHLEELELQELKDPAVLSVLVLASDQKLLATGRKKTANEPEGIEEFSGFSSSEMKTHGSIHRELPIIYNNKSIGSVHITLTDYQIRKKLNKLLLQQTIQALIIISGISLLTYLGLSRILLAPLQELHHAAEQYGRGDLSVRIAIGSNDEIGMLGVTLNRMAGQLTEQIREIESSKNALQQSEEYRKQVFEGSRIAVGIMDAETCRFIDCNQATVEAFGYQSKDDLLGKTPADVSPAMQQDGALSSESSARYIAAALKEGMQVFEWHHKRADGEIWDAEINLMSFSVAGRKLLQFSMQDITERKKTAAIMVQTEKMMMVGGLAAGMAHEINNPLGIITQAAQNIQRRLDPELPANLKVAEDIGLDVDKLSRYMELRRINSFVVNIREATDRAARIISNMLKFSRRSESHTEYVELGILFEQVLELAASDYDLKKNYDFKRVSILQEISPDMPKVPVSVLELEQVLLNLMKNAAQAMYDSATSNPQITLRAYLENSFAVIEVADNGPGMPQNVQKRIFEPFYTTKTVGHGTGLGLSVSYSIITNNHHGTIEVDSKPGDGTCFRICLPLERERGKVQ